MKENGFAQKEARGRRYTAQTNTDAGYADYMVLLENTSPESESLLEQGAGCIDIHGNAEKTEYTYFSQRDIFTLNDCFF